MAELINRVICIDNKKTSMRLATAEWSALEFICTRENIKRNQLLELIDSHKNNKMGLTNAVRLFSIVYLHHLFAEKQHPSYNLSKSEPITPIFYAIKGIL